MRVCVCVCVCVCARTRVMIKAVRWVRGKGLGGCGEGRAGRGCSQEERRPPSRLPPLRPIPSPASGQACWVAAPPQTLSPAPVLEGMCP